MCKNLHYCIHENDTLLMHMYACERNFFVSQKRFHLKKQLFESFISAVSFKM